MNDELLIKFLLKETSPDENVIVEAWILADNANAVHFSQLEKIWVASKDLANKNEIDEEQAWLRFKEKTMRPEKTIVVRPIKKHNSWLRIAAVLVVAVGAWTIYTLFGPKNYTEVLSKNEIINKILPDGSELTINKYTTVSYAANFKENRNVNLTNGEVFFNVAHNKNNPFVIKIGKVAVEVVGTSFNIKHLKAETEVVVESGIVKIKLGNQEVRLIKGEKIIVDNNGNRLVKEQQDGQLYNYYRTKLFIARNTPLYELVETLNEAYGSDIVLDEKIKNTTIYTTLPLGSLDQNLENICETLNLKISRNQKSILLSKK